MSLKKIDPLSISLRLYFYKLKGYSVLLYGLILAQIIALLFSLNGISYMSSNNGELSVSVNTYSASLVIVFSLFWIFYTAIQLTTKRYKRIEIPLVANNITGHLSDMGFLMTASLFGGLTSSLTGVLLRVIMYFTFKRSQLIVDQFFLPFTDLLLGTAVAALYMVLISAIGYLIGVLTKVSIAFVIVIPAMIFGLLRVYTDFIQTLVAFFTRETSFPIFVLKVLITSMLLFGFSFLLSNRREAVQ